MRAIECHARITLICPACDEKHGKIEMRLVPKASPRYEVLQERFGYQYVRFAECDSCGAVLACPK
jgi:hypothetical protein